MASLSALPSSFLSPRFDQQANSLQQIDVPSRNKRDACVPWERVGDITTAPTRMPRRERQTLHTTDRPRIGFRSFETRRCQRNILYGQSYPMIKLRFARIASFDNILTSSYRSLDHRLQYLRNLTSSRAVYIGRHCRPIAPSQPASNPFYTKSNSRTIPTANVEQVEAHHGCHWSDWSPGR